MRCKFSRLLREFEQWRGVLKMREAHGWHKKHAEGMMGRIYGHMSISSNEYGCK